MDSPGTELLLEISRVFAFAQHLKFLFEAQEKSPALPFSLCLSIQDYFRTN